MTLYLLSISGNPRGRFVAMATSGCGAGGFSGDSKSDRKEATYESDPQLKKKTEEKLPFSIDVD